LSIFSRDTLFCLYTEVSYPCRTRSLSHAGYTVREECDERTGEHRENQAGKIVTRYTMHVPGFAADEGFINFNLAGEFPSSARILHGKPRTLQHEPRGFLSDANGPVNLPG
jgi:hypothetical protein